MSTIAVRHPISKGGPTDKVIGYDDLPEVLPETNVFVLACPLTETAERLIGETEVDALPTDAIVGNVVRGVVIDTSALVSAPQSNCIYGAGLDVADSALLPSDHALWRFENIFLTPPVTGHTPKYWDRRADILVENLTRVAETGEYVDLRNGGA